MIIYYYDKQIYPKEFYLKRAEIETLNLNNGNIFLIDTKESH